jgi:hypothetical protein
MRAIYLYVAIIAILFGGSKASLAQQLQPEAFCRAGFDALTQRGAGPAQRGAGPARPPDSDIVYDNCKPGDSIVIPNGNAVLAAHVCDFSKPMITVPGTSPGLSTMIVCIVAAGPRMVRSTPGGPGPAIRSR